MNYAAEVIVIGAGLSGLSAAKELIAAGKRVLVLEKNARPGGRIRTDEYQGFLLDHGFQVLLTRYPEAKRTWNYEQLSLGKFNPGAYIWDGKYRRLVADPLQEPTKLLHALTSPVGTLTDKLLVGWNAVLARLNAPPEPTPDGRTTIDYLRGKGFSAQFIDQFFKPFFSGVFLEPQLETRSSLFRYLFAMFASGDVTLPARGMRALPEALAETVGEDNIRYDTRVESIEGSEVLLAGGKRLRANQIVLAIEQQTAAELLNLPQRYTSLATECCYFELTEPSWPGKYLVLNASGEGLINNICIPSEVQPSYAPHGKSLVSVSTVGISGFSDEQLVEKLKQETARILDVDQASLLPLKCFRIPHALPVTWGQRFERIGAVHVAGDFCKHPSIQGALESGLQTAKAILSRAQCG